MKIRKAHITAGGIGTRFYPVTKVVQKEMLPILEFPTLDYVVRDCVDAGIDEIVLIVNERNQQVREYFTQDDKLYAYLKSINKVEKYEPLEQLHKLADFQFVTQKDSDPYGPGTAVLIAKDHFKNEEAFVSFSGDDLIATRDGEPLAAKLIREYGDGGVTAIVSVTRKPDSELHKYGVLDVYEEGERLFMKGGVEKPEPGRAPSNYVNFSKYLLTPIVFDILERQQQNSRLGELYFFDTLVALAAESKVGVSVLDGEYLDCGSPLSWIKANLFMAMKDSGAKQEILEFIRKHALPSDGM